jgi:hypothetical protein
MQQHDASGQASSQNAAPTPEIEVKLLEQKNAVVWQRYSPEDQSHQGMLLHAMQHLLLLTWTCIKPSPRPSASGTWLQLVDQ